MYETMTILDISSKEAYDALCNDDNAFLIDVRTKQEWEKIGIPQSDSKLNNKIILISWRELPQMSVNLNFINYLKEKVIDNNTNLYFLCKSGGRSLEAANFAFSNGFTNCYNINDGFEGSHFGPGWKSNNLPWEMQR